MLRRFLNWLWPTSPGLSPDEQDILDRLLRRMDGLERDQERRDLEWTMWYDKFRTLFGRIAKRASRMEQLDQDTTQSPQDAPGSTTGEQPMPMPRQWELAALARKNGQ